MKKITKKNIPIILNYTIWGLFWLYIAFNIPYQDADWNWGSPDGINQLIHGTINSRYVGNLLAVILSRVPALKTIALAALTMLFGILMVRCIRKFFNIEKFNNEVIFSFVMLFIFVLNKRVWAQTFGWVAGYVNYVISSIYILVYLLIYSEMIGKNPIENRKNYKIYHYIMYFIFAFSSMLYLENITLIFLVLGLYGLVTLIKRKIIDKRFISIFLGNILGTAFMFINKIYKDFIDKGSMLDNMNAGRKFVFDYSDELSYKIELIYYKSVIILYELWNCLNIFVILFILLLTLYILIYRGKDKDPFEMDVVRRSLLFLLLAFVSLLPFCVILVWGARIYIHAFVMLTMTICGLLFKIFERYENAFRKCFYLIYVVCAIFAVFLVIDYTQIGQISRSRDVAVKEWKKQGGDSIELKLYGDDISANLFRANDIIDDDYLNHYFKLYYDIPDSVELKGVK